MKSKIKNLDDLEIGIKSLLLESRCSFSDEEKVLLNNCITLIQEAKEEKGFDQSVKILESLSRLFIVCKNFIDFF